MMDRFNRFLDWFSEFFSQRKGFLPLLGILLIVVNFILQLVTVGWVAHTNLFLHLGTILAIFGIMLAWAL